MLKMNNRRPSYHESISAGDGFSLVELLVVLALIGLMAGFVASIYLFGERMLLEWKRSMRLQNELHTLADGMSEDIYRAELLEEIGSNYIKLTMPGDTGRIYEQNGTQLLRNGRSLNHGTVGIVELVFEGEETGSRKGKTSPEDITLIRIMLSLSDGQDTLALTRAIHLRRPATWKPAGEE